MKCPYCGNADTQVVDSRTSGDHGEAIRRRRQCGACHKRFTTYEQVELSFPAVVKKNGARVEYKRSKLSGSLNLALRKRPVTSEQIDQAIARIEEKLIGLAQREVTSDTIGQWVMHSQLDAVSTLAGLSLSSAAIMRPEEEGALQFAKKPRPAIALEVTAHRLKRYFSSSSSLGLRFFGD